MRSGNRIGNLFLSYAPPDRERVRKVVRHLKAMGITARDPFEEILPGDNWAARLGEFLEGADAMVAFVSPQSAESENTRRDWLYALSQPRFAGRFVVVQVRKTDPGAVPWPIQSQQWITDESPKAIARKLGEALLGGQSRQTRRGKAA
jgi:hypothetical protein